MTAIARVRPLPVAAEVSGRGRAAWPGAAGRPPGYQGGWTGALAALGLGLALLGGLFAEEAMAAIRTWERSTAYNHCWLVLPVALWLAWQRRNRLAGLAPAPSPRLALLALPAGLAWLAAERLGIMEGRQLAALGLLWALALAVLGWRVCRAMAAPLAYLVFLVPFGAFTVPLLQRATAWMIGAGLDALGIANYAEGLLIETPAGLFHVAEACAGLRFIVAALAFGALYALVIFRSPWRRLAVMGLALAMPVLANGLRALGIVVLAQHLGSAEAAAADHLVYGWGFFSAVILLLVLAGLPFREDGAPPAPRAGTVAAPPAPRGAAVLQIALLLVLGLTAAGPALAGLLQRASGEAEEFTLPLVAPAGCLAEGALLRCPGAEVSARLLVFSPRATWGTVSAAQGHLTGQDDMAVTFGIALPGGAGAWQVRQAEAPAGAVAVAAWLEGRPAGNGLRSRVRQGWNSLRGAGGAPVVVAVLLRPTGPGPRPDPARERALLQAVLEAQGGGLVAQAAAFSAGR